MAFCTNCGKEISADARFCSACGQEVTDEARETNKRQQEYVGRIKKCPACGEEIPALTAICPACGHELNSTKVTSSLASFIAALDECDRRIAQEPKAVAAKKGFKTWDKKLKIGWIILNILTSFIPLAIYVAFPHIRPLFGHRTPVLTPEEQKKADLIENYAFPNDREAILEALLFIKTKIAFLASDKYNSKTAYWMKLWNTKADQVQEKAKLVLNNDSIADATHFEVIQYKNKVQKKVRIQAAVAACIVVAFTLFIIINGSLYQGITNILSSVGVIEKNDFVWYDTGLCEKLPKITAKSGHYWTNNEKKLNVYINNYSDSDFESYVNSCKEVGFDISEKKETHSYSAYNTNGDYLNLQLIGDTMQIILKTAVIGDADFEWPDTGLANMVPYFDVELGELIADRDTYFKVIIYDVATAEYESYIEACTGSGYDIDCEEGDRYFRAFNSDGYEVVVSLDELKVMTITLQAPMETTQIEWRLHPLAKKVPEPTSLEGHISSDTATHFSVYIVNVSKDEYDNYIDTCMKKGYDIDYYRSGEYYSADNKKGYSISVSYMRNNIMHISINAPRD